MLYVFSTLFLLGVLISLFWGIYIIRLNPKSDINRLFALICMTLSVWSFGFFVANLSRDLSTAILWRRFSALGWTTIFSFILHYLLLITNKERNVKFNKYIFLLYIPAIIIMYVFAISNNLSQVQYNLVKIDYGWSNVAVNNGWDYFYYLYYSLYMVLSLVIVWKWKERLKDKIKIKQAKLVFGAIISAGLLGSLTDLFASTLLAKPFPQMAPLFVLIPVWSLYYPARRYDLVNYEKYDRRDSIISGKDRKKIFNNLSLAFYISGVLAFVSEYIPYMDKKDSFKLALIKALTLIGIGIIVRLIQNIRREALKESLTILVLVLSIPLALLQYLKYGSLTVWAFPMIIMISSVIFSNLTLLIWTSVISITTQVLIWLLRPEITVVIDKYDYILRIGMFIVAFFTGFYINKIYLSKIKENKHQLEFQQMASDVLLEFVSLNQENFNEKVNYLLERIGKFYNIDRTYLFTINHKYKTMTYSNEWCNLEINAEVGTIEEIPLEVFSWWIDQLKNKNLVYIENVDFMPNQARAEQEQLRRQGVKSLLSVPVMGDGKIQAFIGIDSVTSTKEWSRENIDLLNIMANILSSGIMQIKADKEIEHMAYYDSLTKLPNRFLFEDRVNKAIEVSKRTSKNISIIFIDLDNFKSVNDTLGHQGGDILLQQVAEGLQDLLSRTDIVARFGGDEFMIMINNVSSKETIIKMADKIMDLFSEVSIVQGQEFSVTASAGIAIYPEDGEDSDSLVKNADIAMYEAKAKGKNQYALCTKKMKDELLINTELSNDLSQAIENDELVVFYQPQIDLTTRKIIGVEALLRWIHPEKGVISPGIFIPVAEKNGLINKIGEWVLKTACRQNKKWQDMGLDKILMAVNLSPIQMKSPNIAETIGRIINESGIEAKYMELEITESFAINETKYAVEVLSSLKKIGVSIAIDDFGTEYSSLNRLKLLPIDQIKIDMQFVQGIETNEKDQAIIMVIINLAKSLGLSSLAEGVETKDQLSFLDKNNCDHVQGYYYHRPMPAEEVEKVLKVNL